MAKTTTAWLVEHGPADAPIYLRMGPPGPGWTRDPGKATRFSSEADAMAVLAVHEPERGRVTEHQSEDL